MRGFWGGKGWRTDVWPFFIRRGAGCAAGRGRDEGVQDEAHLLRSAADQSVRVESWGVETLEL